MNSSLGTQRTPGEPPQGRRGSPQLSPARVCPRPVPGEPRRSTQAGPGLTAPGTRRERRLQVVKLDERSALAASLWCAPAAARPGEAPGPICSTSGAFAALRPPSRVSPPRPCPVSLPRGSGREGGVSGAGGRDLYKSAGGARAGASLAALRRDRERRGKHGPWRGRCARATQCVDYLQPLLVQYAGAPERLNGVATPLPGLDHSAAFPYEEDTSE